VKEELSYDRSWPKADHIYRITNEGLDEGSLHWAVVSPLHALEIGEEIPEIELATRLAYRYSNVLSYTPKGGESRRFEEKGGFFSDPATIEVFDLKFIKGNPKNALEDVNTIVLTKSMAERYFGDEDPMGKTISDDSAQAPYKVTGVIEDVLFNTHWKFDYLLSMSTMYKTMKERGAEDWMVSRGWAWFYTYVLIHETQTVDAVRAKMPDFTARFYQEFGTREEISARTKQHLQPITDIHLHSRLEQEMGPNSNIIYVYVFACVALFILLIAGVNFINIATAQAFKRMKEVGVRKVLGAYRHQLQKQFLGESYIMSMIAAAFALVIFDITLPFYNQLAGKDLSFVRVLTPENIGFLVLIIVLVGTLAGLYPAFFMSKFKPANTLKNLRDPRSSVTVIRKGLVIFQFVISIFMIFSTITIYRQLELFQNMNLGFEKDKLVAIDLYGGLRRNILQNTEVLRTEFLRNAAIAGVTVISTLPGDRFSVENLRPEGTPEDKDLPSMRYLRVDENFLEILNIQLKDGRNFIRRAEYKPEFILNETAVQALELKEPVGKMGSNFRGTNAEIVGVVKDFNFASLHNTIEPLVLEYNPAWTGYLLVKFQGNNTADVLEFLEMKAKEIAPETLFMYTFVDEHLNRLYEGEDRVNDIFQAFSLLAIFISCLGLFGLSAYSAEIRTKEIGVRKVVGATVTNIVVLLTKEFTKWVLISAVIAWPLAYFAMNSWLQNFAYRIDIDVWAFILSGVVAIGVAILTVSYQSIKAAIANPIDSLRYE
jgi:putative ABC transport system permease protein